MSSQKFIYLFCLLSLFSNSCKKNPIASEFEIYIDRFVEEGKKRNVRFNTDNLYVSFSEELDGASYCKRGSRKNIVINRAVWNDSDEMQKEKLIFHELGHCLLAIFHDNCILPDGSSKSIMCGIEGYCSKDVSYCFANYRGFRRGYYLDYLYEDETPAPWWSKVDEYIDPISTEQKVLSFNKKFNDTLGLQFVRIANIIPQKESLNFENISAFTLQKLPFNVLNQENVEINTTFKFLNNEKSLIELNWAPFSKEGNLNEYVFTILQKNNKYFFVVFINSFGFMNLDISKHINVNKNNVFRVCFGIIKIR